MRLSPPKPYNNGSYAELQVFDAFRKTQMPKGICFNSFHLVSHREKRMSEIDFVLICSKGLFVFEVKGGRVFQSKGKWYSRSQQKNHSISNPFNQSRSALFSLLDSLKSKGLVSPRVPIGYGVLLPNTHSLDESVEYDTAMVGTQNTIKGFSAWLDDFIDYWVTKVDTPFELDTKEIMQVANYLRPDSVPNEIKPASPLKGLNYEQQQVVTAFENGNRIICEGAAGTGKTHLIGHLANSCIEPQLKLLILCESKWLKGYLNSKWNNTNIVISTIDSLQVEARRAFISQYDIVIVDEAQDLYNSEKIKLLDGYIKGGFDNGRWILFQDLINQSSFFSDPDLSSIEKLDNHSDLKIKLSTAYRYSKMTLDYLSELISSKEIETKRGPDVEAFKTAVQEDEIEKIESAYQAVIEHGYKNSDITFISPNSYSDSIVSKLPSYLQSNIIQVDDYNIKSFPFDSISYSELQHFKGLENKVVILVDFTEKELTNTSQAYVALTRASVRLFIVWSPLSRNFGTESNERFITKLSDINEYAPSALASKSERQYQPVRTLVVLANSIKNGHRCVAGKCVETKEWIRPVSTPEGKELTREQVSIHHSFGTQPAKLLQKVRISFSSPAPLINQPENCLIDNSQWQQKLHVTKEQLELFLDAPDTLWGRGDRVSYHNIERGVVSIEQSLFLVRVDRLMLYKDRLTNKRRANFRYNGVEYDLAVTSPNFDDLVMKQEDVSDILCISLGESFHGNCFKIVAAIY